MYHALSQWDREAEAQAKRRQMASDTHGVAIGVEGGALGAPTAGTGQGRTLLLNLDPYYEVTLTLALAPTHLH